MDRKAIYAGTVALMSVMALSASDASAAVIFKSALVTTSTSATAKRNSTTNTQTIAKTNTTALLPTAPLTATSAASAVVKVSGKPQIQSNATATGAANFADAANGSFDFLSGTSIVQSGAFTRVNQVSATAKASGYTFQYNFQNIGTANFTLDYALFDPNIAPGNLVNASLTGPTGAFSQFLPSNASGSIFQTLSTGLYSLTLKSSTENLISRTGAGIGSTTGSGFDHFSFSVASVPEPATWAMTIVGFGFIGGAMRRREKPRLALA